MVFRTLWEVTGNWCTHQTVIILLYCNSSRPIFQELLCHKLHSSSDWCGLQQDFMGSRLTHQKFISFGLYSLVRLHGTQKAVKTIYFLASFFIFIIQIEAKYNIFPEHLSLCIVPAWDVCDQALQLKCICANSVFSSKLAQRKSCKSELHTY